MGTQFERYIGIDYSGAETPYSSLSALRVYLAGRLSQPVEVLTLESKRKYWSRAGIAGWLLERLSEDQPALIGIDHGFSFPLAYFEKHNLSHDWPPFLEDFQRHWPTDEAIYVDFVRDGSCGNAAARSGDRRWRRLTEARTRRAKSVFFFDVQGSVAKSTHAGLPWLLWLRKKTAGRVHFWPFDGWELPAGRHVIAEIYPALWSSSFAPEDRNNHQHDAYSAAAWLRQADAIGELAKFLKPRLTPEERRTAEVEGWILGVP
jgi:hypothetical protein